MKNKIVFFAFVFMILFCCGSVSASTKTGINIDAHEHFNYYYEQKNGTGFYNWLRNTKDFEEFFNLDYPILRMRIFYSSELVGHSSSYSNNTSIWPYSIPDDAFYAIDFTSGNSSSSYEHCNLTNVSVSGITYTLNLNTSGDGCHMAHYVAFFDSSGNFIKLYNGVKFTDLSFSFDISGYDDESSANFTYLLSMLYNDSFSLENKKIIVTDIIEDGVHYLIDDNDNYSGWLRKLFSFGKLDYVTVVDTDLNYFKSNVIKNSFPSLKTVLESGINLNIPDGFSSFILNDDTPSGLLIPKNINDDDLNRNIFSVGVDVLDRHLDLDDGDKNNDIINPQITIDLYDYNNSFVRPHSKAQFAIISPKIYAPTRLDFEYLFKNNNLEDKEITDYAYSFGLYGHSIKLSASIYYNSAAYSLCVYNSDNPNSCSFVNPKTNEQVSLSSTQFYSVLKKSTLPGQFYEDSCAKLPDYDSSYNYDMNCNKTTLKDSTGSSGVLSVFDDISKFINSFKEIFVVLFSYFTLLFNSLPFEIRSIMLFSLVAGTVLLLYKIIRG